LSKDPGYDDLPVED
jgi:uncharacterized protein YyaL (SSP411 family)